MKKHVLTLSLILLVINLAFTQNTATIGPSGDFTSLWTALETVDDTLTDDCILEIASGFEESLQSIQNVGHADYTITIKPQAGTTDTIKFEGVTVLKGWKNIIFEGRPTETSNFRAISFLRYSSVYIVSIEGDGNENITFSYCNFIGDSKERIRLETGKTIIFDHCYFATYTDGYSTGGTGNVANMLVTGGDDIHITNNILTPCLAKGSDFGQNLLFDTNDDSVHFTIANNYIIHEANPVNLRAYGIHIRFRNFGVDTFDIHHNTIVMTGEADDLTVAGVFVGARGAMVLNMKNNIIHSEVVHQDPDRNFLLHLEDMDAPVYNLDYNLYSYNTGTTFGEYLSTPVAFSEFFTESGLGEHSDSTFLTFPELDNNVLSLPQSTLDDPLLTGTLLPNIETDINDNVRSNPPKKGAYEAPFITGLTTFWSKNPGSANLHVYPSPFEDEFFVEENGVEAVELISSATGAIVYRDSYVSLRPVSLPNLAPGVYIIRATKNDGTVIFGRVIKK